NRCAVSSRAASGGATVQGCGPPASTILYPPYSRIAGAKGMLRATADKLLPTTITGSLPRPSWYTENLGLRSFLEAMVETRFREQYEDALAVYINQQTIAGLDILTDGDARFSADIGGQKIGRASCRERVRTAVGVEVAQVSSHG